MQVQSLGGEDPLGEGTATHSSILVWGIQQRSLAGYSPLGHKAGRLQSMGSLRVRHD